MGVGVGVRMSGVTHVRELSVLIFLVATVLILRHGSRSSKTKQG